VALQDLGPATASYDALEAALSFDAEAIYFLTDGAPFGARSRSPAAIVTVISKLNRLRRMTVNSIGIGVGQEGNVFDAFLKALANAEFWRVHPGGSVAVRTPSPSAGHRAYRRQWRR